jgi:hypothetical protein
VFEPFELKTYSDGTTNYSLETFIHTRINHTTYTYEKHIVNGVTYYPLWSEIRPSVDPNLHVERYYNAPLGSRVALGFVTAENMIPAYQNINGIIVMA